MPHTFQDLTKLGEVFEAIMDNTHKLTMWEANQFIPNVFDKWNRGVTLSERELEILEEIYLKV